jgi:hypothetical protein
MFAFKCCLENCDGRMKSTVHGLESPKKVFEKVPAAAGTFLCEKTARCVPDTYKPQIHTVCYRQHRCPWAIKLLTHCTTWVGPQQHRHRHNRGYQRWSLRDQQSRAALIHTKLCRAELGPQVLSPDSGCQLVADLRLQWDRFLVACSAYVRQDVVRSGTEPDGVSTS